MWHPSFTSVHGKGDTRIQFLFSFCAYSAIYALSILWSHVDISIAVFIQSCQKLHLQWGFCLPFSLWRSNNQAHCNHKLKVKMSILLFGLSCQSVTIQNEGIHYVAVIKYQRMYFHALTKTFNIITIYTIHVSVVQLNVSWLIYWDHIMTKPPACVNNISLVWTCTDKSYNSIALPNSGTLSLSCHPGMICKYPISFYQICKYHLKYIFYSLILSDCSIFYKPVSPSITGQM